MSEVVCASCGSQQVEGSAFCALCGRQFPPSGWAEAPSGQQHSYPGGPPPAMGALSSAVGGGPAEGAGPPEMYAPAPRRLLATVIDLAAVGLAVGLFSGLAIAMAGNRTLFTIFSSISALLSFAMAVGLWFWQGRDGLTLGNKLLKIRIVDEQTHAPTGLGRAILWWLLLGAANVIPVIGAVIVLLSPGFDSGPRRQGWIDKIVKVVALEGGDGPPSGGPQGLEPGYAVGYGEQDPWAAQGHPGAPAADPWAFGPGAEQAPGGHPYQDPQYPQGTQYAAEGYPGDGQVPQDPQYAMDPHAGTYGGQPQYATEPQYQADPQYQAASPYDAEPHYPADPQHQAASPFHQEPQAQPGYQEQYHPAQEGYAPYESQGAPFQADPHAPQFEASPSPVAGQPQPGQWQAAEPAADAGAWSMPQPAPEPEPQWSAPASPTADPWSQPGQGLPPDAVPPHQEAPVPPSALPARQPRPAEPVQTEPAPPVPVAARPTSGPGASFALQLESGETLAVTGPTLIGRNPQAPDGSYWALVPIPDPTRSVSKTHLELDVDADGLWVCDRGSTNGTIVETPGHLPQTVGAGSRVRVPIDSIIHVGDRRVVVRAGAV